MRELSKLQAISFVEDNKTLFDAAEKINPFAGSAWTLNFLEHIAEDSWRFLVLESKTSSNSLVFLYAEPGAPLHLLSVSNYYTSLTTPWLSRAEGDSLREAEVRKLVADLKGLRPPRCSINISPLDDDATDTNVLLNAISEAGGWYARKYDCFGNWFLPCQDLSFDNYMRGRSSKVFNTWSRKRKRFEFSTPTSGHLEIVLDPSRVDAAMDAYERIYAKSWKRAEPYQHFIRSWARVCARNGWLRLGIAWLQGTPVAAQFWFVMHGRAYIFKLAYDSDYSNLSAGTVLSAHMFKHALDVDQVSEIDYLTGDDPYKSAWMTHRRQRVGIIAYNLQTARGLVAGAKLFAGVLTKRWRSRLGAQQSGPSNSGMTTGSNERDGPQD